ncbi:Dihydroxyacetone kinase [Tolypocladium paradoxum]|uniref:Dihydroxyacetone kinase n=1 Tax=Tolypocladium paradoxum TaxID=94208 RepID=A0A2S4KLJ6_9HYPO|nr:Dihydroxyacetone kinase [Tolypocladium paradoxum]
MSTKHYFSSTAANTLVPRALRALVTANPHLALDEAQRVVANKSHDPSTVSIIGGGGSGHEPAWSGFVGDGLLAAAACGDIFASPSTKQVLAAMRCAPSDKGTILLITNYTGDRLHFGLAAERAKATGLGGEEVALIAATDDVSIGRTMKIMCAAAADRWSFSRCMALGQALNAQTVSIGSALDHCHVPGRQHQSIPEDVCVIGAGIHNEPGQTMLSPFPSVQAVVKHCLALLCDQGDAERAFVQFETGDSVALLVNNYGGLSPLELGALTDEVQTQLASTYDIKPCRTFAGAFETSLNAPGFSISLCNISAAARECQETSASELLELLDRPTTAVSWPVVVRPEAVSETASANGVLPHKIVDAQNATDAEDKLVVDPSMLEKAVRSACEAAISAEPKLTEWDMVMGDGDCGEAVKGLCEAVLRMMDDGVAAKGSVLALLMSLMDAVDDMGGTLGAIFGILLSAFYSALRAKSSEQRASSPGVVPSLLYAAALASAVESLMSHTPAREGDRTVMDVLIPFANTFARSGDFAASVKTAAEKADATRFLEPRLGRASYVGKASGQELPDPGAWALYEMLSGFARGLDI